MDGKLKGSPAESQQVRVDTSAMKEPPPVTQPPPDSPMPPPGSPLPPLQDVRGFQQTEPKWAEFARFTPPERQAAER
jgi:hypothetical protein